MSEHELLESIKREIGHLRASVDKIYSALYEGDPSLITKVALHEERISTIEESRGARPPKLSVPTDGKSLQASIITIVTALAGLIAYFVAGGQ